ncbi:MAG: peptidase domain-containing ABC transporter [Fimbriimonas sp.]
MGSRKRLRRVPLVFQATERDCGAACACMVLRAAGQRVRLGELRDEVGGAVNALALASLLRNRGVEVRAYRPPPEALAAVPVPFVALLDHNHFVVVEGFRNDAVQVADPAKGRQVLGGDEFARRHTGFVLTFPASRRRRRDLWELSAWREFAARLFRIPGARRIFAAIVASSVALQLGSLGTAYITRLIVDQATTAPGKDLGWSAGMGIGGLILGIASVTGLRSLLLVQMQIRLDTELSRSFLRHLLTLPLGFFVVRRAGDLIARMNGNTALREIVTNKAASLVFDSLFASGLLVALAFANVQYAGLVLALGVFQGLLPFIFHEAQYGARQASLRTQDEVQSYTVEVLRGIHTVKASGAEPRALTHWMGRYDRLQDALRREGYTTALSETVTTTLAVAAPLSLLWLGATLVGAERFSVGTMMALNMLAASVLAPLGNLATNFRTLQIAGAHIERIGEVMDARPEQETAKPECPPLLGRIELRDVSFRYALDGAEVVRDVSCEIEAGSRLAIVGRSGSGKSTLAMLLLGLYPPASGEVRVDGRSIHDYDLSSLRGQLGVVLQDPFLFSGTIRENIRFYRPEISDDGVRSAAEVAAILPDIESLPMGFDTVVREGGVSLSGGQRQRLALARAIASDPSILLLDEATSHLDAVTEHQVAENLRSLRCTQVIIAHRLSTIRDVDLILVMREGSIVERGTHAELVRRGGYYAELISHQQTGQDEISSLRV